MATRCGGTAGAGEIREKRGSAITSNQRSGGGKGGGKSSKQSDGKWKMWKPVGTEYDSAGKRVCDNQSCNKLLSNDEYKKVSDKQKTADEKGQSNPPSMP